MQSPAERNAVPDGYQAKVNTLVNSKCGIERSQCQRLLVLML